MDRKVKFEKLQEDERDDEREGLDSPTDTADAALPEPRSSSLRDSSVELGERVVYSSAIAQDEDGKSKDGVKSRAPKPLAYKPSLLGDSSHHEDDSSDNESKEAVTEAMEMQELNDEQTLVATAIRHRFPMLGTSMGRIVIGQGIVTDPKEMSDARHAFVNLCKGFIGAASFSLPWAVSQTGVVSAAIGFMLLACLCYRSKLWLMIAGRYVPDNPTPTYPEMGYKALGQFGSIVVWFALFAAMIGGCGTYLLFISGVVYEDLKGVIPLTRGVALLLVLPFPLTLACLRSYRPLAATAKWGLAGVLLALLVTTIDAIDQWARGKVHTSAKHIKLFDLTGFPIFAGNAAFLFVLHMVVLSLEQQMVDRGRFHVSAQLKKALRGSIFFVGAVNTVFALFLYTVYSHPENEKHSFKCYQNIVNALDTGPVQIVTKVLLCIDLLFTYAIIMYPFTEAFENRFLNPLMFGTKDEEMKRSAVRTVFVLITAAIAYLVPHFGYLTGLTGGIAGSLMAFVFPPLFIYRLAPHRLSHFDKYFIWVVFAFGCCMFVMTPALILRDMFTSDISDC